jgi:ribose 5-phosphate isomerase A
MHPDQAKQLAADRALTYLPERGIIGLGSGSTAKLFIQGVGHLIAAGRDLKGVPTSEESRALAESLHIPLLDDQGPWSIDVCVDGADEVSDDLDLIKGGGGCQTREKIVNFSSRKNIIVVDSTKLSSQLGERWAVPVEVLPFGRNSTIAALERMGETKLRLRNGTPWMTDAGNFLYDVRVGVISHPGETDRVLRSIPGVVETGLFVRRADLVIVAGEDGIRELTSSPDAASP